MATSLATFLATPAQAVGSADPLRTYVEARAAAIGGNHREAAQLLAALAKIEPDQPEIASRAFAEALDSGQFELAVNLARGIPAAKLNSDARMLIIADEIRHGRTDNAIKWLAVSGDTGDLTFLAPLINAWDAADHGDSARAITALDQIGANSLLAPLAAQERALILLKFKRSADAEPFARRAVGSAGSREDRVRLALADGFLASGDKPRALMIIDGMGGGAAAARARIAAGKPSGQAIDNGSKAFGDAVSAFAADLTRMQRTQAPVGLVQVARFADPQNSGATLLLAVILDHQNRSAEALALLGAIDRGDGLISSVRDVQARILIDQKQVNEAYQIAASAAAAPAAGQDDFSRLGEVYAAMKRSDLAADAYGRAIALAEAQGPRTDLWTLHLLQASALEDANRWPEAKATLAKGLALAPDEPLLLNFLGYAKLEHGEDVEAAEAMIRKASELDPDDASITDSLGWAQFKRGKTGESIATLQQAAEKDPGQAEIQEHLGDALFKSGRRLEARFAWNAALITAGDDIAARVKAKLEGGVTTANAAP